MFAARFSGLVVSLFCVGSVLAVDRVSSDRSPHRVTNSIGMSLVLIPAGEFRMGASTDRIDVLNHFEYCDSKAVEDEFPPHEVRITRPFYLGQCEVTLGQFLKFYHDANYRTEMERDGKPSFGYAENGKMLVKTRNVLPWAPGWGIQMNHPVVYVTWNDAVAFCKWLSETEHHTYRLPTEAEWEYACRGGGENRYCFGSDPEELVRYGNIADGDRKAVFPRVRLAKVDEQGKRTSAAIPYPFLARRDGYAWTAPVGKFLPNPFGLYDMHGNVWEWCSDHYAGDYYKQSPVDDPKGPATGAARTARGGGFSGTAVEARCSNRIGVFPSDRHYFLGFRVLREK